MMTINNNYEMTRKSKWLHCPSNWPPDDSEWKPCLEQIDRFDGHLFDLRKCGFTLITGLINAGSFLGFESGTRLVQVGVIL
jgi:hypothetical protein